MIDVADLYLDNLYVEGTLELDQSTGSGMISKLNNEISRLAFFIFNFKQL